MLTLGLVLVTVMTYPLIPHLGDAGLLGTPSGRIAAWRGAWVAHAIVSQPRDLFDANMFFPARDTLATGDPALMIGVLGAPLLAATRNPIAAVNSAIVLSLLIAFMATWALVRRLTGSTSAGIVAAVAYAFGPFACGHGEDARWLMIGGVPLLWLAFERVLDRPGWISAAALGGAVVYAGLSCGTFGVLAIIGVAVALFMSWRRRIQWMTVVGAAGVAVLGLLPVLATVIRERAAAGTGWLVTGADLWQASALARIDWIRGGVVLALALAALLTSSSAPDGEERHVVRRFGALAVVGIPGSAFFGCAVAILAGIGATRLARGRSLTFALLVPLLALSAFSPWRLREISHVPAAYRLLATLPAGPAVDLPLADESEAMWWSAYSWQPMVNGAGPPPPGAIAVEAAVLRGFPDEPSIDLLQRRGVRYIVWRLKDVPPATQRAWLDRIAPFERRLRRITAADDVWLYELASTTANARVR